MRAYVYRTSSSYGEEECTYDGAVLDEAHPEYSHRWYVEVQTIEDLLRIANGGEIVVCARSDGSINVEIYDGYRE